MEPERFSAAETPVEDVVAACQALSFGGMRAVIVEDADALRAPDADRIVAYLEDPNPTSVLALVSGGAVPQRLLQAIERLGGVLRWGPDPKASARERRKWLETHFSEEVGRFGGRISPAVARFVVERVCSDAIDAKHPGVSAMTLTAEAQKLAAYAAGEQIDREMVLAVVPPHPEARVYELADALTTGRAAAAYAILQDLATGDDKVAPIVVQAGLMRHFRALAAAQSLGPGASADAVSQATGLKGFPAKKVAEQVASLPAGAGARGFVRLARLELDLRVAAEAQLGTSPDDGQRFVLERAARDVLRIVRGVAEPEAVTA
jgi:DNA polymerase III delta subunit